MRRLRRLEKNKKKQKNTRKKAFHLLYFFLFSFVISYLFGAAEGDKKTLDFTFFHTELTDFYDF